MPCQFINLTNVVKAAKFILSLNYSTPPESSLPNWQNYRWCLQESLNDYLNSNSKHRLPGLSVIETIEHHLKQLLDIIEILVAQMRYCDRLNLEQLLSVDKFVDNRTLNHNGADAHETDFAK